MRGPPFKMGSWPPGTAGVTAWGDTMEQTLPGFTAVGQIKFEGCYYWRDIAHRPEKSRYRGIEPTIDLKGERTG